MVVNDAGATLTDRLNILIADDEEPIRQFVREALEGAGYQVVEARNGVECLRLIRAQHVDLVITDILMPDMDGLELVGVLSRDFPHLRIITMSGGKMSQLNRGISQHLGAHATLAKPFTLAHLQEMVANLLGTKR